MVTRQQRKKAEWPVSQELLRTHPLFITTLPGSDTDCFPTQHKATLAGLHQQQSLPELKRRPRDPRGMSHRLAWELESSRASAAKGRPRGRLKPYLHFLLRSQSPDRHNSAKFHSGGGGNQSVCWASL